MQQKQEFDGITIQGPISRQPSKAYDPFTYMVNHIVVVYSLS